MHPGRYTTFVPWPQQQLYITVVLRQVYMYRCAMTTCLPVNEAKQDQERTLATT